MPDSPSPILRLADELRDRHRAEADRLRDARTEILVTPPPRWAAAIARTVPPRPLGAALATLLAVIVGAAAIGAVVLTVVLVTRGADVLQDGRTPPFAGHPALSAYVLASGPIAVVTAAAFAAARRSK